MDLKEYQEIADKVLNHFGVYPKSLKIRISNVKGGWAYGNSKGGVRITLPKWLEEKDDNYAIYYCIHEVSHVVAHLKGSWKAHDAFFKRIEDEALALYGIEIVRAKRHSSERAEYLCVNGCEICIKLKPNQT